MLFEVERGCVTPLGSPDVRSLVTAADSAAWALLLMRRTGLRIAELRKLEYHCTAPRNIRHCSRCRSASSTPSGSCVLR
jgi:hypothetical protein